jgi:hypothetical protein
MVSFEKLLSAVAQEFHNSGDEFVVGFSDEPDYARRRVPAGQWSPVERPF